MYLYLVCRSIGYEQILPNSLVRDVTCETQWRHLYARLTDELSLTFTFVFQRPANQP